MIIACTRKNILIFYETLCDYNRIDMNGITSGTIVIRICKYVGRRCQFCYITLSRNRVTGS